MAAEDGLKAQKLLAQGSALGNVGKNKVALKGQKLSISMVLAFSGRLCCIYSKPRALPWARSFCPFRAYGMWLMTHPHYFWGWYLLIPSCSFLLLSFCFLDVAVSVSIEKFLEIFYLLA